MNTYSHRKTLDQSGMMIRFLLSLALIVFSFQNIWAQDQFTKIIIPPDPEDLINGYVLIEEVPLSSLLMDTIKQEVNHLSQLPDSILEQKVTANYPDPPQINLALFIVDENTPLNKKLEVLNRLQNLDEVQLAIEQISFADCCLANANTLARLAIKRKDYYAYKTLKKIQDDLWRTIISASISLADLMEEVEYKIPSDYMVKIPKSIRSQLKDKNVRYSELKRLGRELNGLFLALDGIPRQKVNQKYDGLYQELAELKNIQRSLYSELTGSNQLLPEEIQKELSDFKTSISLQEKREFTANKINNEGLKSELEGLKGIAFYPLVLNTLVENILESENSQYSENFENDLNKFVANNPSNSRTQKSLILLGKIELTKTRPEMDKVIHLFKKAMEFPSLEYYEEAVYLYSKWSFISSESSQIEAVTQNLEMLIKGYAYSYPNEKDFKRTVKLYLERLIENNGKTFEQNEIDIRNHLLVTDKKNYDEAIKTIYLETLYEFYNGNPEVYEIINDSEAISKLNPVLKLLKIKIKEEMTGDLKEGYARRILLLDNMRQQKASNYYLIPNQKYFMEKLHFQIFELAVYLGEKNLAYVEHALTQAEKFLSEHENSPYAFNIKNNCAELVYLTSTSQAEKLESYRYSMEALAYTSDINKKLEILEKVIKRILENGYETDITSDDELLSVFTGKNGNPSDQISSIEILNMDLLQYMTTTEKNHKDQKLLPVVASDFAKKGMDKTASFLYQSYISGNPTGIYIQQALDGFFLINRDTEDQNALTQIVDKIVNSDRYSDEVKEKAIQYQNELKVLLVNRARSGGNKALAEEVLQKALQENPDAETGASALFELGLRAAEEEKYDDALDYFLSLIDLFPESNLQPEALQNYAFTLEKKKKSGEKNNPSMIQSEDIGFAYLRAARADIPNEKKNPLYLKAILFLKYGTDNSALLECLKGFYDTNEDPSRNSYAIDLFASLLWQEQDLNELARLIEAPGRLNDETSTSQFYFYKFLIKIKQENMEGAKSVLSQMEEGPLKNTMNAVLLDSLNKTFFDNIGRQGNTNLEKHSELKKQFEKIRKQYGKLLEDNTLSSVRCEIKLADYQKELADDLRDKGNTNKEPALLHPHDTAQRLNEVISSYEVVLNSLLKAGEKLELLRAVYDTMVLETGRSMDFYWDFLGIYSAEILNQYSYYSEEQLFQNLNKEIEDKKKIILNETLDVLQNLIRHFMSVNSPGRDEMSIIYYDYSVLNGLVLPRFEMTTELIKSLESKGIEATDRFSTQVGLYSSILDRNSSLADCIFLNQYEPSVSALIETVRANGTLSRPKIDILLDLQELMADVSLNGIAFSKSMTACNFNDQFLKTLLSTKTESYLVSVLARVQSLSRIRNTLKNLVLDMDAKDVYMVEDMVTGSKETEIRILQNLWVYLENSRDNSPEFRQSCLIELAAREPSQYIHLLGLEGKKQSLCTSENLYKKNLSISENSEWEVGPLVGMVKGGNRNSLHYFVNPSKDDTLSYTFTFLSPDIIDGVKLELVSCCDYEIYVNSQYAAEGELNTENCPDIWDIDDLIIRGEENNIRILLLNRNREQDSRVAWRLEYNSFPELETLIDLYNKRN